MKHMSLISSIEKQSQGAHSDQLRIEAVTFKFFCCFSDAVPQLRMRCARTVREAPQTAAPVMVAQVTQGPLPRGAQPNPAQVCPGTLPKENLWTFTI